MATAVRGPVTSFKRTSGHGLTTRGVAAVICWFCAVPALAQTETRQIIEARVGQLRNGAPVAIGHETVASTAVLPDFYERRAFEPAWTEVANVDALLAAVRDSTLDGLNPQDYHLTALEALRGVAPSNERDADLDLLATDATVRLGYHLRFGKVEVQSIDPNWNFVRNFDAVLAPSPAVALEDVLAQGRVTEALAVLRPASRIYAALREALAAYRDLQERGGWKAVAAGKSIRPGESDPRVPALRERLAFEDGLVLGDAGNFYDPALEAAVRDFQVRHGLSADGIVGARTIRALNVPVQTRVDQLRLSLERGRQILHDLPARFVLVNVAGFRIYYVDETGRRFAANAVVGRPFTQTPIFRSELTHVVLNPSWTVPPGILKRDVLPGLQRDPQYLERKGLKRVGGQYVQPPGPNNALGRLKLMFPNPHLVYLHDTPQRDLFDTDARIFSSGCIRVQNVFDLAELVLDDPERWSKERLLAAADTGKTQTIRLKQRVPVLITYWTAAVSMEDSRVYFYEDVYGRDPPLLAALESPFQFSRQAVAKALVRLRKP